MEINQRRYSEMDEKKTQCAVLQEWMNAVAELREKTLERGGEGADWDGLRFNEAASVAFMGTAAVQAGNITLVEYSTGKRKSTRGRRYYAGRADLLVAFERVCWAVEAKQLWLRNGTSDETIEKSIENAVGSANALDKEEANQRVACVIAASSLHHKNDATLIQDFDKRFADFLSMDSDFAYRIGGGELAVWIVFRFIGQT